MCVYWDGGGVRGGEKLLQNYLGACRVAVL